MLVSTIKTDGRGAMREKKYWYQVWDNYIRGYAGGGSLILFLLFVQSRNPKQNKR